MTARSNPPLLAIIITNGNTPDIQHRCLRSVFENLGDLAARVVLVDNAPPDGSSDRVKSEFPHVELIRNGENRGLAAGKNKAIRRSREEFVLLLDGDTVVLDQVLSASVAYLTSHPNVGALGCRVLNADRSLCASCSPFPTASRLFLRVVGLDRRHRYYSEAREVDVVDGCFLLVRRDAIARAGLLDEEFSHGGDLTDWCRRIRESGFALHFAPVGEVVDLGGGSRESLNADEELRRSSALVRANQKRAGRPAALAAWVAMALFHLGHGVFYRGLAPFSRQPDTRERGRHHLDVVCRFREAWI